MPRHRATEFIDQVYCYAYEQQVQGTELTMIIALYNKVCVF